MNRIAFLLLTAYIASGLVFDRVYLYHLTLLGVGLWKVIQLVKEKDFKKFLSSNKYVLFFISYIWISLIWTPDKSEGLKFSIIYTVVLSLFLFLDDFKKLSISSAEVFYKYLLYLMTFEMVIAVIETTKLWQWPLATQPFESSFLVGVSAFRGNPNNLSLIALLYCFICLSSKKFDLKSVLGFTLGAFLIVNNGSRTPFMALLIVLFIHLFMNFKKSITMILMTILASATMLLCQGPDGALKQERLVNSFHSAFNLVKLIILDKPQADAPKDSVQVRSSIIHDLLKEVEPSLLPVGKGVASTRAKTHADLHFYWLEILFEFGLIGLIAIILFLASMTLNLRHFYLSRNPINLFFCYSWIGLFIAIPTISSAAYFLPFWLFIFLSIREAFKPTESSIDIHIAKT